MNPAPGDAARAAWYADLGDRVYLDTASKALPPAPVASALHRAVDDWAAGTAEHADWAAEAERARASAAGMLGLSAYDVSLCSSQAGAAATIARAWPDATVVVPAEEFRSNLLPWTRERAPDRVRLVPEPATTEAICAAIDAGTDLVALSSVQSANGLRVDLPAVVAHAHAHGARVYVDASQSLGVDATLAAAGADFVGVVGYKWVLGTRGAAFLGVRREHQLGLAPLLPNHEIADDGAIYGAEHQLWADARRLDHPRAWLPWVATAAGLEIVAAYAAGELDGHATALARRFRAGLPELGLTHGPLDQESAIVSVIHPDAARAAESLAGEGIRVALRPGALRAAFHLHNTESDVERVLAALRAAGMR